MSARREAATSPFSEVQRWLLTLAAVICALSFQTLSLPQIITGVFVNFLFVFLLIYVGWRRAMLVGFMTPLYATVSGHLPPFLIPLIPFIAVGNLLMIFLNHLVEHKHILERVLLPPVHKAAVIGLGGLYIYAYHDWLIHDFQFPEVHTPLFIKIVGLQYATAAAGAVLAILLSRVAWPHLHHKRHHGHHAKQQEPSED